MRHLAFGVAAAVAIALVAGAAMADFKSTCMAGSKNDPDADKNCSCMASKIKPEDLPAATKAGDAMNAAEASGKSIAENPPADVAPGVKIIFDAMAQCMSG